MHPPSTRPLETSYLLFPRGESRVPWLMPLTDHAVKTALHRMRRVDSMSRRDATIREVVFSECRFCFPLLGGVRHALTEFEESAKMGWHAHPDLARFFSEPFADRDLLLHMQAGKLYPSDGGRAAVEACWFNLMYCRLATAPCRAVPGVFREFAEVVGFAAVHVLERGLVFHGNDKPVRDVKSLLTKTDMITLLEDHDRDVRERAIAIIGTMR